MRTVTLTRVGHGKKAELTAKIAGAVKIPVQVAGGIRSPEKAEEILSKAARVVLGTMAYSEPETVRKLAKKNPGRIVISIDQAGGKVMIKGWKESTGTIVADAIEVCSMVIDDLADSISATAPAGPDVRTLAERGICRISKRASHVRYCESRERGCISYSGQGSYDGR